MASGGAPRAEPGVSNQRSCGATSPV